MRYIIFWYPQKYKICLESEHTSCSFVFKKWTMESKYLKKLRNASCLLPGTLLSHLTSKTSFLLSKLLLLWLSFISILFRYYILLRKWALIADSLFDWGIIFCLSNMISHSQIFISIMEYVSDNHWSQWWWIFKIMDSCPYEPFQNTFIIDDIW